MHDALTARASGHTLDEAIRMTDEELRRHFDQMRDRFERMTREPGEIRVHGRPIARLRCHFPDRQTPALPIIVWT